MAYVVCICIEEDVYNVRIVYEVPDCALFVISSRHCMMVKNALISVVSRMESYSGGGGYFTCSKQDMNKIEILCNAITIEPSVICNSD